MSPGEGQVVYFGFRVRGELTNHSLILSGRDKKKKTVGLLEVLTPQVQRRESGRLEREGVTE